MICVKTQHFGLNRILLLTLGLWPYHQSKFVQFQGIIFFGVLTSCIILQIATFLTTKCTFDFIIKVLSIVLIFVCIMIQYYTFWSNIENVKYLMEHLQHICNKLKDENEIAIMRKYGGRTKLYTIQFICIGIILIVGYFTLPSWQYILRDPAHPEDIQSHYKTYIMTEYIVDPKKYFYLIILHADVTVFITYITAIATISVFLGYMRHVCGMFEIARYRLKQAITFNMLGEINFEKNEIMMCKKISCAVDIHRQALEFCSIFMSTFETLLFLLVIASVLCLSFNLFQVFQIINFGESLEEFMIHAFFAIALYVYMFLANYCGQEIINYNNYVFLTAYSVQWYAAPLHIQKLILFILQRGSKTYYLSIGKLFSSSYKTFAMMIRVSMSYFTVMYSILE